MNATVMEDSASSDAPATKPRWVRLFIDFAFFAGGILLTNLLLSDELLRPVPYAATGLCLVLLIHGSWRVVPATFGVGGLMSAISVGISWSDGVYLDSSDIWPVISFGACFGLPAGAYYLPSSEGRNRAWGVISRLLCIAGLLTAGVMSAALWYWVAEKLALGKWL